MPAYKTKRIYNILTDKKGSEGKGWKGLLVSYFPAKGDIPPRLFTKDLGYPSDEWKKIYL